MFCQKCGSSMPDTATQCAACGWQVQNAAPVQQTPQQVAPKKKGCLPGCLIAIGIFIVIAIIGAASSHNKPATPPSGNLNSAAPTSPSSTSSNGGGNAAPADDKNVYHGKFKLIEMKSESDSFAKYVVGTIENISNDTIGYAQVEINVYDSSGAVIGSTLANINNIEPKQRWKFKAPVLEDNAAKFQIKDISGF